MVFITKKSVSFSLSYSFTLSFLNTYIHELGEYSNVKIIDNKLYYFPYIIYILSPSYSLTYLSFEIQHKKSITGEQLIGIVCSSVSTFLLSLGAIIFIIKKKNEVKSSFQYELWSDDDSKEKCIESKKELFEKNNILSSDDDINIDFWI